MVPHHTVLIPEMERNNLPYAMEVPLLNYPYQQRQMQERYPRDYVPEDIPINWMVPSPLLSNVNVTLQNQELWRQFHALQTEMIITKTGRRMFPTMQIKVNGLQRHEKYCVILEMRPMSNRRHKYCGNIALRDRNANVSNWTNAGPGDPQQMFQNRIYIHKDGPSTGAHWMENPISFCKMKLTNNDNNRRANNDNNREANNESNCKPTDKPADIQLVLSSMHKYAPVIWIVKWSEQFIYMNKSFNHELFYCPATSFIFKETEFIAVTAYQSPNITNLKIECNPFAKGFRESGKSRCKRKLKDTHTHRAHRRAIETETSTYAKVNVEMAGEGEVEEGEVYVNVDDDDDDVDSCYESDESPRSKRRRLSSLVSVCSNEPGPSSSRRTSDVRSNGFENFDNSSRDTCCTSEYDGDAAAAAVRRSRTESADRAVSSVQRRIFRPWLYQSNPSLSSSSSANGVTRATARLPSLPPPMATTTMTTTTSLLSMMPSPMIPSPLPLLPIGTLQMPMLMPTLTPLMNMYYYPYSTQPWSALP